MNRLAAAAMRTGVVPPWIRLTHHDRRVEALCQQCGWHLVVTSTTQAVLAAADHQCEGPTE